MPLPPYIASKRAPDEKDLEDYQTVFAQHSGAVAAPTAGLHFTDELLAQLADKGVEQHFVTLHVGAGTFLPVKTDNLSEHKMHAEWGEISAETAERPQQSARCRRADHRRWHDLLAPVGKCCQHGWSDPALLR